MQFIKMLQIFDLRKTLFLLTTWFFFILLFSCTGPFNWQDKKFPCNESRPCADGFRCFNGYCISNDSENVNDDGGSGEYIHNPDSPYRPPVKNPKIAFLYVGPIGDFGWTWAHEQSRLYLKKLGYQTTAASSVSVKDAPNQIETFIKKGYNTIIGTSFDFLVPTLTKASQHKDINFLECSGFQTSENLGSYFGRLYQVEWLAGMLAGTMTKTNRIGVISTVPIPEMVRHINAFALGVAKTNPKAVVIVKWVKNWFDPKREPLLTKELLKVNTDIIHSHTDTSIPLELIENKSENPLKTQDGHKVYTIGYNTSNACSFGPRTCLASVYWNWGPMLKRILDKMKKGRWNPRKIEWEYLRTDKDDSSFHITALNPVVPGTERIRIESYIPKLANVANTHKMLVFRGPIKDNKGNTRLEKGKDLNDQDLLNMCWFVSNVRKSDATTPAEVPLECKGDR